VAYALLASEGMRTPGRILGHTIHPMLVPIPIGLFLLSLVFDLIAMNGSSVLGAASFWSILGGIAGGLLAAMFGLLDWTAIPSRTRAKRIGLWHGAINVVVVTLFAISWLVRLGTGAHEPNWTTVGLEIAAVGLLLVSGWLGGELVDRLGVGVDDDANVDATSSLGDARHSLADARPSRI
jgi:uncharacterized membrane protein